MEPDSSQVQVLLCLASEAWAKIQRRADNLGQDPIQFIADAIEVHYFLTDQMLEGNHLFIGPSGDNLEKEMMLVSDYQQRMAREQGVDHDDHLDLSTLNRMAEGQDE